MVTRYALVKNGKVENIAMGDEEWAASVTGYDAVVKVDDQPVSPGDSYDGTDFSPGPPPLPDPNDAKRVRLNALKAKARPTRTPVETAEMVDLLIELQGIV